MCVTSERNLSDLIKRTDYSLINVRGLNDGKKVIKYSINIRRGYGIGIEYPFRITIQKCEDDSDKYEIVASELATNNPIVEQRVIDLGEYLGEHGYALYTTIAAKTVIIKAINDGLLGFQGCILCNPENRIRPIVH